MKKVLLATFSNCVKGSYEKKNQHKQDKPNPLEGSVKVCHTSPLAHGTLQPQKAEIDHF